jgi:hypothetical protein
VIATPAVGDIDDDGLLEVVVATRLGTVHVWNTAGPVCGDAAWRKARHDEWNTGTVGTDTLRPAWIDDLSATASDPNVTLAFTSPGSDGRCGSAASYEVREQPAPLGASTWDAASPVDTTGIVPAAAGTPETLVLGPYAPGVRTFWIRAVDAAGNAAPPAAAEAGGEADTDGDGVADPSDNCPDTYNPSQADSGGLGTALPDGTGDACQCGDVDADGQVQLNDATVIKRAILGLAPGLTAPAKCNVAGPADPADSDGDGVPNDCLLNDATVVKRAILVLSPGIAPVCAGEPEPA